MTCRLLLCVGRAAPVAASLQSWSLWVSAFTSLLCRPWVLQLPLSSSLQEPVPLSLALPRPPVRGLSDDSFQDGNLTVGFIPLVSVLQEASCLPACLQVSPTHQVPDSCRCLRFRVFLCLIQKTHFLSKYIHRCALFGIINQLSLSNLHVWSSLCYYIELERS